MGSVEGPSQAHRAESLGVLEGLEGARLLHHLQTFTGLSFPFTAKFLISCDNQRVINALDRRRQYDRVYANATLTSNWDVLEDIHQTYSKLPEENLVLNKHKTPLLPQ